MNKKMMIGIFGMFALVALVSAVLISHYGTMNTTLSVVQPITINGESPEYTWDTTVTGVAGNPEPTLGEGINVSNSATFPVTVAVTDNSSGTGIDVSYVSKLILAQKNIEDWTLLLGGLTETITYTTTGSELIINNIPSTHTLVYFPNIGEHLDNVAGVQVLSEGANALGSLPTANDVGDEYCNNGKNPNAKVCNGAKLWLIEGNAVEALAKIESWDATGFLFETDLIVYTNNADGQMVIPANSTITFYPEYTFDVGLNGTDYSIKTTIDTV